MTFKEKLFIDHPEYINDTDHHLYCCPADYRYEKPRDLFTHCECQISCKECWEREME